MEKEFPNVSFPVSFPNQTTKRELFVDFGTCGQLNVERTQDCAFKFQTQRMTNNFKVDVCASHPTLPLDPCPTHAIYPFPDCVSDQTIRIRKAWNFFLPSLQICKSLLSTSKKEYLADIIQGDPVLEAKWFSNLLEKYEIVSSVRELPTSNSQYTGGALSYLPCAGNSCQGYLISAAGGSFSSIKIQSVQNASDRFVKSQELSTLPVPGHIYQTNCNSVHNKDFCAVRLESSCIVYTMDSKEDQNAVELKELGQKMCSCTIMAISLSPYIPSECLITKEDGSCLLWNSSQSTCEEVVSVRSPRFKCHDRWCHTHFGAQPRQLVYADSAALELLDLRMKQTGSIDLFSLPNKLLHKRERIRSTVAQSDSSFYHLVATDYSLILLDERFPGYPVLKWEHLLKSPPRYLSSSPYSSKEVYTVFVGSQYPPEVVCLRYQHQRGLPPQADSVPWRASKKSDFIYWPGVASGPDKYLAEERLNLSLTGQAVSTTDSEITLFQMDSIGDIFYQVYGKRNLEKEDITFSAGPGSADLQMSDVAIKIGRDWLVNLIKQKIQDDPKPNKCLRANSSEVFGAVVQEKLVHCFCSLCIPIHEETRQVTLSEEMICMACTHSTETAHKITVSTAKDSVLDTDYDSMRMLELQVSNIAEENHPSATSRLLKKLWVGDPDIHDILVERDNEVQEKRKECLKQKPLNEPDLGLMEKLLQDIRPYQDEDVILENEDIISDNDIHEDEMNESSQIPNVCVSPSLDNSFEKSMDNKLILSTPYPHYSDTPLVTRTPQASSTNKRKRHSSVCSVGSVHSQRSSSSIPGFGVTPLRKHLQQNSLGASPCARSLFAISNLQCHQLNDSKTSGGDQSSDQKQSETILNTNAESEFTSESQEHFTIFTSQSQVSDFGLRTMSQLKRKQKSLFEGF